MIKKSEVERIINDRKLSAERKALDNYNKAIENSEFLSTEKEIHSLTFDSLNNGRDYSEELKKLQQKRQEILKKIGLKEEDFVPHYFCEKCKDTGRNRDGSYCSCYKALLSSLVANETGFESYTFDRFDINVFSDKEFGQKLFKFANEYVDKFDITNKRNILLIGDPGTGKTFVLACIYNEMINRDINAMYTTAFNLNQLFLNYHTSFSSEKGETLNALLSADLLVIDDLGSEPIFKNVSKEYFFNLINDRNLNQKHTLFSSNLNLDQLLNQYGDRIMSRLTDKSCTTIIEMKGKDIRHN